MRGHLRERSPGHWAIVIDVRDPEAGKRKQRWYSFRGTKRQAQVECARLISEIQNGTAVEPSRMTVAAFLERWIEHMQGQVSPRSHERYAEIARKNLAPLIGGLTLTKLQPTHISRAYAKSLAGGRRDGKGGLSARTVTHMHRVLREALQQAVRWQLLARNPADAVKPPKVERKQMNVLDTDATAALIEAARPYRIFIPILLGVLCGLRRGEIAALRWKSVDLEAGQLRVIASIEQTKAGCREKETKSGRDRVVALPAMLIAELRRHRAEQAQELLQLGVRLADDSRVVAQADGSPLQPNSLTHAFADFLEAHGLQRVRLHDLRHSHATHLLAAGIHPKVASERLGHSKVGITLDLYSHVLPGMQAEAAAAVDNAVKAALQKRAADPKCLQSVCKVADLFSEENKKAK
jgi:integrase